ncbi:DMT family transporter, partial [Methylobacterium platani]|uniref:DMT family transporter n=1 Tax=Methylobacterium platani TaxID=427683 RepID=UPI000AB432BD
MTRAALPRVPAMRIAGLTALALLAFAGNSLLCRLALAHQLIDPGRFTVIRLVSGAAALWLVLRLERRGTPVGGSWGGALALCVYAGAFSFAYVTLPAGAGALLLFGAVQVTMVAAALVRGERPTGPQALGFVLALGGLAALLGPGASAPSVEGSGLMIAAGVAWGAYSLLGRGARDPLAATAGNFLRAAPVAALALGPAIVTGPTIDLLGVAYAALSGILASGLGYAVWYAALRGLSPVQGASVQLGVPVVTAVAGAIALD